MNDVLNNNSRGNFGRILRLLVVLFLAGLGAILLWKSPQKHHPAASSPVVTTAENRAPTAPGAPPTQPDADTVVDRMAMQALGAGMTAETEGAVHAVALTGNSAVPKLGHLIGVGQALQVREAAALALAKIGSAQSISVLMEAILSDPDESSRRMLVSALHVLSNPEVAPALASALTKSNDLVVFPTIRDTLARLADAPGTMEIVRVFHEDAHEGWQQSNLMGALLRVRSEEAISALTEIVSSDPDSSLRSQAAIALGLIGTTEAVQSLTEALNQSKSIAQTDILVESLAAVNNKGAFEALAKLLKHDSNERVRSAAAIALGNIPNESSASALQEALQNESSQPVQKAIQESLVKLTK